MFDAGSFPALGLEMVNMSESQSRYSIVERLTNKKLELLAEKSGLDTELQDLVQNIIEAKKELEAFKKDEAENRNRSIRSRERKIEQLVALETYKMARKDEELKTIDAQIVELDKAMKSIEKISESAPSPEEQN